MNEALINMTIGVAIGAIPFAILWAMANRRASDWQHLAEQMGHEVERAQASFHNLYALYLRAIAMHKQQRWEGDIDESERWKQG